MIFSDARGKMKL